MSDTITLVTLTGLPSRIVRVVLGTPFLIVGGLLLVFGMGALPEVTGLLASGIGGIFAFVGAYSCYRAVRSDELRVTLGESSGTQFE
jgi:uncharacterized membrane protein